MIGENIKLLRKQDNEIKQLKDKQRELLQELCKEVQALLDRYIKKSKTLITNEFYFRIKYDELAGLCFECDYVDHSLIELLRNEGFNIDIGLDDGVMVVYLE